MKKVLVFGGSGLVGSKFINLYSRFLNISTPDAAFLNILNKDQIIREMNKFNPDFVINFAAYTSVEEAEKQKDDKNGICFQVNAIGAKNIAESCHKLNKKLIHISTEYVFDGTKTEKPYTEDDKPNPINWYGYTKYAGEQFVVDSGCPVTIVRICMPYSSFYEVKLDVARFFVKQLKSGNQLGAITDQKITPTLVDDISVALKLLLESSKLGIYHVCSKNSTSPYEFAKMLALSFDLDQSLIKPVSFKEYNLGKLAKLLQNSWLDSSIFTKEFGGEAVHTIEESLEIFKQQLTATA